MNRDQLLVLAAELGIIITRENFVQKWQERFGDSAAFIRATFDAYDENKDGQLSVLELEYILKHVVETVGKLGPSIFFYVSHFNCFHCKCQFVRVM